MCQQCTPGWSPLTLRADSAFLACCLGRHLREQESKGCLSAGRNQKHPNWRFLFLISVSSMSPSLDVLTVHKARRHLVLLCIPTLCVNTIWVCWVGEGELFWDKLTFSTALMSKVPNHLIYHVSLQKEWNSSLRLMRACPSHRLTPPSTQLFVSFNSLDQGRWMWRWRCHFRASDFPCFSLPFSFILVVGRIMTSNMLSLPMNMLGYMEKGELTLQVELSLLICWF